MRKQECLELYVELKNKTEKYIMKMRASGIGISAKYYDPPVRGWAPVICAVTIHNMTKLPNEKVPISVSSICDGRVILTGDILSYNFDPNEVNFRIQGFYILRDLLNDNRKIILKLNRRKMSELEQTIKRLTHLKYKPASVPGFEEAFEKLDLAYDWLAFKEAVQREKMRENMKGYIAKPEAVNVAHYSIKGFLPQSIKIYKEIENRIKFGELTEQDLKTYTNKLGNYIMNMSILLEKSIGVCFDIFCSDPGYDEDDPEHEHPYIKFKPDIQKSADTLFQCCIYFNKFATFEAHNL